jgi:drug/metabolite transporter (DMT)-like permease
MKNKRIQSNILLLSASLIWGFAFVAQRRGMDFTGPLTFNGVRFLLGAITLIPFMILMKPSVSFSLFKNRFLLLHGIMAGMALFFASSFQQVGIIYTSAGKAGFITSLYILFVPAFGLLRRQSSGPKVWAGAIIATFGLYLLSVHENMQMDTGDLLVLISAVFWAMHMIILSYVAPLHDFRALAFIQFFVSGAISLALALFLENPDLVQLENALLPILYAGIASAGIGFTLQVAGQRHARADHAALILSLEAVFAVLGGYLLLKEKMTILDLTGCALMLAGVIISQYRKTDS